MIEQNIYYYEDEDGNKVYDIEGMVKELEAKLKELDPTIQLHVLFPSHDHVGSRAYKEKYPQHAHQRN